MASSRLEPTETPARVGRCNSLAPRERETRPRGARHGLTSRRPASLSLTLKGRWGRGGGAIARGGEMSGTRREMVSLFVPLAETLSAPSDVVES